MSAPKTTTIKIGYRRLYDAMGCSFADRTEFSTAFFVGDTPADVYIGPQPKFGVTVSTSDKYFIPGATAMMMNVDHQTDASLSSYPRRFFTEIVCWKEVEVLPDLLSAFQAKQASAPDSIFSLLQNDESLLWATADYVAGIIGLRFHRQLVLEVICENFVAPRDDGDYAYTFAGRGVELLESGTITSQAPDVISQSLTEFGLLDTKICEMGVAALGWLLRAWPEQDNITKFVSLFTPLEIVLSGVTTQVSPPPHAEKLRAIIQAHGDADRDNLLKFLDQMLQRPPSLAARFEAMARQANMAGVDEDIKAFKRFNRIRNDLIHQGEQKVSLVVEVGEDEVRQLQDIAERYISWRLFGDGHVYFSVYRNLGKH